MTTSKSLLLIALFACVSTVLAETIYFRPDLATESRGVVYGTISEGGKIWQIHDDYSYVDDYNFISGSMSNQALMMNGGHGGGGMERATSTLHYSGSPDHEITAGEYSRTALEGTAGIAASIRGSGSSYTSPQGSLAENAMEAEAQSGDRLALRTESGSRASSLRRTLREM